MFTTYERDAESGNDYAQARYNVNRLARFSSPDPIPGNISDPQSLNRYSYVRNMPVMAVDPTGMCPDVATNPPDDGENKGVDGSGKYFVSDAEPDQPQQCASAVVGDVYIDGGYATGATGLYGGADANDSVTFSSGWGPPGGGWQPDPNNPGESYNPSNDCYTVRGTIHCNAAGYAETYGAQSDDLIAFLLGGGGGGGDLTKNFSVLANFKCLFAAAGYGFVSSERSEWITQPPSSSDFGFVPWPSAQAGYHQDIWNGPIPTNTVAQAHTHPNGTGPQPTPGDLQNIVNNPNVGVPVYTLSQQGIWMQAPGMKNPAQVQGFNWANQKALQGVKCK